MLSIDDVDGGYVASLGVARRARAEGLGEALLQAAIARFVETGSR